MKQTVFLTFMFSCIIEESIFTSSNIKSSLSSIWHISSSLFPPHISLSSLFAVYTFEQLRLSKLQISLDPGCVGVLLSKGKEKDVKNLNNCKQLNAVFYNHWTCGFTSFQVLKYIKENGFPGAPGDGNFTVINMKTNNNEYYSGFCLDIIKSIKYYKEDFLTVHASRDTSWDSASSPVTKGCCTQQKRTVRW